ncbi:MAG: polyisoprenyl-teichoic acid--peptidoglycan teichoic acid transferase [Gaiellaceae bacterium]|jgi:LCP family protein required for cell wall assembly|nr:polyisoprenyl-teichoic acid--peptidoglycan teichoic acid transferase [Gaiellaceae bacterium]
MADGEKPYRVYKGGRVKGKVPAAPRPERAEREPRAAKAGGRPRWGRRIALAAALLAVLLVVWIVASYLSFRAGVADANDRLPKAVASGLAPQDGPLISKPSLILLLGTDGDRTAARADAQRSDSILLVRTDPKRHRLAYLSIPRDLRVDIPGYGPNKINAAFQLGGAALAMKSVRALTGLQPNHVVIVNFDDFRTVVDALGGVEIDVPKPILSNRFDCPYATSARCQAWPGWRFAKGRQTMNGRRALVYSRVRENRLDPADNDLTRGARQQAVVQAMAGKLTSMRTFLKLPFIGGDLVKPLTTDLSAGQLVQLGWVYKRSNEDRALRCRLGGEPQSVGGASVLIATEENTAAVSMFSGLSAPQPPPPGTTFGAGCNVGRSGG